MRRLLGFKNPKNAPSSNAKGKERQRDLASTSYTIPLVPHTPMEIHVSTEVQQSAHDRQSFVPLESSTNLTPPSSTSSDPRPLPPEIRVPTHPYPYWQGYTHTPSSSQSSLGSPMTPSHVSWLNTPGAPDVSGGNNNNSNQNLSNTAPAAQSSAGPPSDTAQGRSSPSPHFPPPPPMNPPPNISARPKLVHPTKSSYSLRVPVQEFFNQQLSPIVEQDYFSPEKRPSSLPSSYYEAGSRNSTAHTMRTSVAMMTPVSPGSEEFASATVTPVSPVPITPILFNAKGTPPTPPTQAQTPVTPSYPGGVVPFSRRKEEESGDSPRPSPVSTFILRPLNRSISLSSTRTHQSSVSSVTPPVIPPLDLRPEFKGQFLTTPTSLRPHGNGMLDVGMRDDDSVSDRRESFITARTGAGRDSKYSLGQEEIFVDAEEGFIRDIDGTVYPFDSRLLEDNIHTDAQPTPIPQPEPIPEDASKPIKPPVPARTHMHLRSASHTSSSPPSYKNPTGPQSSDNYLQPRPQPHPHRSTPSPSPQLSRLGASAPSLHELGPSISTSSSFVDRRFALSSLYLPSASERESARKAVKWKDGSEHTDTVRVLFWLGFIAPWCWLIGGWSSPEPPSRGYSTRSGYGHGHEYYTPGRGALPLWTNQSRSMQSLETNKMQLGYPFIAPSASSLMPLPSTPYESRALVVWTPRGTRVKNPWVKRCRIAAVTSGVLLAIGFIVALVVIGTNKGF